MRKSQFPLSLCSYGSSDVPMPNARASAGPELPICYSGTLQTCTGLQLRYLAAPSPSSLHNHTIPDTFRSYYTAGSPTVTGTAASSREATPPLPAEPESKPKIRLDYEQQQRATPPLPAEPESKPKIRLDYQQQQRAGKVRKTGNARTYRALFAADIPDHTEHEEPEKPPADPPANIPTAPTQPEKTFLETLEEEMRQADQIYQGSQWEMDVPLTLEPEPLPWLEDLAQVAVQELAHIQDTKPQEEGPILADLREQWRTSIAFNVDPPPPKEEHKVNQTYQRGPRKLFLPRKDWLDSSS
ncbi:uncharacterized protein LOC116254745 isoform X1 [Nymphaea colorata]|nr:uncharacterized protein LOC116254745 isoform X1 [Nymphaea colorata]XP_031486399.1 uncharacterized protein LOC116254745 isoform X1 [Nymphaea colorata]XP_031486400.1 uncharacterized protein LOC116254745 isoform X1 [Nymphaea colorata]XP_031486401.1 uncharacterized protein LOC116254745 isoform X1 [Nymphaea colorata]